MPVGAEGRPCLTVEHLTVAFGGQRVLEDVSFTVDEGESLAVIGPNGAGKTVLFKALIGSIPYRGRITWAPDTTIGHVPQKLDISRDLPLTGLELLGAKAGVRRTPPGETARALHLVGLEPEPAARPIGALSGGQFQRLILAFALVGRPRVLLFDEPTAGIDEPGEEAIYTMLQRVQQDEGLTLLLISHELSVVYRYASRVLCLSQRRAWLGPPAEILTPERLREVYGTTAGFHIHDHHGP